MGSLILATLYLFLPAYAANMAPVVANKLHLFPSLVWPLDRGTTWRDKPVLGPHKTFRGLFFGILAGVIVALLQWVLIRYSWWAGYTLFPFADHSAVLWGALLGAGALVGDMAKSFIKRRFNIPPGSRWFPWDQLDMVVGGILFGSLLYHFSWHMVVILLLLTPPLVLVVNLGSYVLSVKEAW